VKLLVVSGLSGSGKTIVLQALEDLDYFCVDNLPISLLLDFSMQMAAGRPGREITHVAVGIDSRNSEEELQGFRTVMDSIRDQGIETEIVFLEASNSVLLKRFSETRRKHPLTRSDVPLATAIAIERKLLGPIAVDADLCIDTSRSNVHQLRKLVRERIAQRATAATSIQFMSFGYKFGVPEDADFVFDIRCLPNPYWDPRLRLHTGRDEAVIDFLRADPMVEAMYDDIRRFLEKWIAAFKEQNRSYITIALGCTGGQHRSVYLVERLAEYFQPQDGQILIRHRELIQ
jgi:UPF0042 nucleotide-binding protein